MDILAARKKAAELALQKAKGPAPEALEQPALREESPAAEQHLPPEEPAVPEQPAEPASVAAGEETAAQPAPLETRAAVPVPMAPAVSAETETGQAGEGVTAPEEPVQAEELEMLSFRIGSEEYAVNVDEVKEVLKNRELTPVPNAPDYLLGVMALRGPVLPVIDLSKRLGIPASVRDEKSRILIVSIQDEDAGFVVDRVTGVLKISPDSVRPVPETIEAGAAFLRGIARKGEKLYILLDIEKVLAA